MSPALAPRLPSGNPSASAKAFTSAKATADRTADEPGWQKAGGGQKFHLTGLGSHSKLCTVLGGGRRPGCYGGRREAVRLVFDIGAEQALGFWLRALGENSPKSEGQGPKSVGRQGT